MTPTKTLNYPMIKSLASKIVKNLIQFHTMICLALSCAILATSCSDEDPLAKYQITEEDAPYHKFACTYLRAAFENKISLSHEGINKLRTYIESHDNDWGRIELLTDKTSEKSNEVEVIVQDRVTKEIVAVYNVEISDLAMKSGNLKINQFTWYLK